MKKMALALIVLVITTTNVIAQLISGPTPVCPGLPSTYSFSGTGYTFTGWTISSGTGSIASSSSPTTTVTWTTAGTLVASFTHSAAPGSISKLVAIKSTPNLLTVGGGGARCDNQDGVSVSLSGVSQSTVSYMVYVGSSVSDDAEPRIGNGGSLSWPELTAPGSYTVRATHRTSGCYKTMTGSATISIGTSPAVFNLSDGSYCTGDPGATVTLSSSESGVNYQLKISGVNAGSPKAGTGSSLQWTDQTTTGKVYTVQATDSTSGCSKMMNGTATVTSVNLPSTYTVSATNFCSNDPAGGTINLSDSDLEISYQLKLDGTDIGLAKPGTGNAISWTGQTSTTGSYTVVATNGSGCTSTMTGSATLTSNPSPIAYALTGGNYCPGGSGASITIANSQSGVNYQLKVDEVNAGAPVAGTGSSFSWPNQTTYSSDYAVIATNATTGCFSPMSNTTSIVKDPTTPADFSVSGSGTICAGDPGLTVSLSGSETGNSYQLMKDGMPSGSPVSGSGGMLSWTNITNAGNYTVYASNPSGCGVAMSGTASISVTSLPTVYATSGTTTICEGYSIAIALSGSETGRSYQLKLDGNDVQASKSGNGSGLSWSVFASDGTYTISGDHGGCVLSMSGNAVITTLPSPQKFELTGGGPVYRGASGNTIKLSDSETSTDYLLTQNGIADSTIAGTGNALTWKRTIPATYKVIATKNSNSCKATMKGEAIISTHPIPEAVKLSRDGRMPDPPYEVQYLLADLHDGDVKDVFPPPCMLTGNYRVGFQLMYDIGDRNTTINWLSQINVTMVHEEDSLVTIPLVLNMNEQVFVATGFYDSLISCGENYHFVITEKQARDSVPEENIYLKVLLYKDDDGRFTISQPVSLTCSFDGKENNISWSYDSAATEFDLEWVYIAKNEDFSGDADSAFRFKEPARVTTVGYNYKHLLFYDSGTVWYRIRAVKYNKDYPDHRMQGDWFFSDCNPLVIANPNPDLNWQEQTVFAEDGKYKKVLSYFDGSMRQRQAQTNLSSEHLTLVGETLYDFEGRKAVDIMPVPALDAALTFRSSFNLFKPIDADVTASVVTQRDKFHYDNYRLANSKLDTISGTGQYYSPANAHHGIHQGYTPDSKGFAYSQTEYTNDGTGRVSRQSGVGEAFIIDGEHATRYFYGSAAQSELVRLFGTNVGNASHYKKNMAVDPNGQVSITYVDQEGRTIATALAGDNPSNVDALPSLTDLSTTPVNVDISNKNHIVAGARTITHTLLNTIPNSSFEFRYDLSALASEIDSIGCQQCVYRMEFTITNPDGKALNLSAVEGNESTDSLKFVINDITAESCSTPYKVDPILFTIVLPDLGDYSITKKLIPKELTFEDLKTIVLTDSSVTQSIALITGRHAQDSTQCQICDETSSIAAQAIQTAITESTASDCQNVYQQIVAGIQADHPDVAGYKPTSTELHANALWCQYELCIRDQQSEVFDKKLSQIQTWTQATTAGLNNAINLDPFFNVDSLSGHSYKSLMTTKLGSITIATVGYDSNGDGTQDGETTYTGAIAAVTDPDNTDYYIDPFGNPDAENGTHMLYGPIMDVRATLGETLYHQKLDSQRWVYYRTFYADTKRRTKLEIPDYAACTPTTAALSAIDDLPHSPDEVAAWQADQPGAGDVSDPELKTSLYSISTACNVTFSESDSTSISSHLQSYFNSAPTNMFRLILTPDVGVNADLIAIQGILDYYGCSLDSIKLIDPLSTCLVDSTIVVPGTYDGGSGMRHAMSRGSNTTESSSDILENSYAPESPELLAIEARLDSIALTRLPSPPPFIPSTPQVKSRARRSLLLSSLPSSAEYDALMAFYAATNGSSWTNNSGWSSADPDSVVDVTGWYGVVVDGSGHVTQLGLTNNNLTGYVPEDIGDLTYLESLILSNNPITGTIPTRIGDLTNLKILYFYQVPLTGTFPAEIGLCSSLQQIWMQDASLTGSLPVEIGNLTNLTWMVLQNTGLSGDIPTEIGNLTALTFLAIVMHPGMTGSIPASIGNLTNLQNLYLGYSGFTGSIPTQIGNLTALQTLYLQGNHLTGSIPTQIGALTNLTSLILQSNSLSGSLPTQLGSLSALTLCFLDHNSFTGSIPSQLGSLSNLQYLLLQYNSLTGTIPTQLSSLSNLLQFVISANGLTGSIPPSFTALTHLTYIDMSQTHISGVIPLISSVSQVQAYQANLSFTGILPAKAFYPIFTYSSQDSVGVNKHNLAVSGKPFTLKASIDRATSPASSFQWFKRTGAGDVALNSASTSGHSYTFTSPTSADNAKYYYTITNSGVSGMTLTSRMQSLTVADLPTTSFNFCLKQDPSNPTLQSFSVTVDWNEQLQQCMANQAKGDSILTQLAIDKLLETTVSDYYKKSSTTCLANVTDSLSYTYANKEYHYTLYYFDQAGNLRQTVPPNGVNVLSASQVDSVIGGHPVSWSGHSMLSKYKYNSLNEAVWQISPDADSSIFFYDRKGQLRFSRNAQQKTDSAFSYLKYDKLGRVIEVGQLTTILSDSLVRTQVDSVNFPLSDEHGNRLQDVALNHYDQASTRRPEQFLQTNLRNRLSWVEVTDPINSDTIRSYYSYDIHGNLKSLMQGLPGLRPKRVDYAYDLVSGKVNYMLYQFSAADQFTHQYTYDSDNRISNVHTSSDRFLWSKDANYAYNLHGQLARIELAHHRIQGIDYQYTLQGWIKRTNMPYKGDPGNDGIDGSVPAKDVFAYSLGYYEGDYQAIDPAVINSDERDKIWTRALENIGHLGLYNGNISATTIDLLKVGQVNSDRKMGNQAMLYGYDQLNRVITSRSLATYLEEGFSERSVHEAYDEDYNYDANGNIINLHRRDNLGSVMDNFDYSYYGNTNKLERHQVSGPTYAYDGIGNLIRDNNNEGRTITWTPFGKVRSVQVGDSVSMFFKYDPSGNRVEKKIIDGAKSTLIRYLRDANGNVMGIYNDTTIMETSIYGSGRLGQYNGGVPQGSMMLGKRNFELSNHLGSVLAVITDNVGMLSDSVWATVTTTADYYPYGLPMTGRTFDDANYRFGFNGQEKESEIKSGLTSAEFWMYDARIARRWNRDPKPHPSISNYSAFSGNPILYGDPLGDTTIVRSNGARYDVVGGSLNGNDNGIYLQGEGNKKVGKLIGYSATPQSFYFSDGGDQKNEGRWMGIIDPNDHSGSEFLNRLQHDNPSLASYMANATTNERYDFKATNGTENVLFSTEQQFYRGMPLALKGPDASLPVFASARDVGNIAAGMEAGFAGLNWTISRFFGFDLLETTQKNGKLTTLLDYPFYGVREVEGSSTQYGQRLGYRIASEISMARSIQASKRFPQFEIRPQIKISNSIMLKSDYTPWAK